MQLGVMLTFCIAVNSHSVGPQGYGNDSVYDTSGQLAPPGAKPRVTATLWEDEGSLCFQIEARGVCVARREGIIYLFALPPVEQSTNMPQITI